MARILTVSDIHIHDYPQRNPSEKFRLYQSRTLAENIINAGKQYECDYIVFAGDILEKSIIRPYIQSEVKLFLDRIMSEFQEGWIIWGNHDLDSKSLNQLASDTCLSVMLPNNLHYADGLQITLDSSKIAFSNWKPEFDLSWISGTVDVLFTHATISYFPGDPYQSQPMDESKFNLAICGDIHKMAQKDKYVSIGVPQRCKMGDSEHSSGVVYDTCTKQWGWVNLNPDDNLLKLLYTENPEQEGYDEATNTWYTYHPSNVSISDHGVRNIVIPEWEKIEKLTQDIIFENGLSNVHAEVLRHCHNLEALEVDFNFTLTKFHCKNWRSIEEATLYFNEGDKILIRGANGSGKSSLLSAIKYAFTENRFLKEFIQFGAKECLTEVEFIYQGKRCLIQRGTKKYGLFVDDSPISYGSKRDFEEDIHVRFPFIDYMDVFFFDEDHLKLIGDIAPERKSEIISKFFKLDKIDYFNQVASDMHSDRIKGISGINDRIKTISGLLSEIENNLSTVVLPSESLENLEKEEFRCLELHNKYVTYTNYISNNSRLKSSLDLYTTSLAQNKGEIEKYPALGIIEGEIATIDEELNELRVQEASRTSLERDKKKLIDYLEQVKTRGIKVKADLELLESSRCPVCNRVVDESEIAATRDETRKTYIALQEEWVSVNREIKTIEMHLQTFSSVAENIRNLEKEKTRISNDKLALLKAKRDYDECERQIERIKRELGILEVPEAVSLPEGFMEHLTGIKEAIFSWRSWIENDKKRSQYLTELENLNQQISTDQTEIKLLELYIDLTSTTGKIYEEIMTRLSKEFSDNQVKYEVITYEFRKKKHLDLASYYSKSGNWVSYAAASSGQKTVLDVNFLSKVVTRLGLLIMDEFLKSLDAENHDLCIEMIDKMNVGCIMLSSHMETIGKFNNKSLHMSLNDSGETVLNLVLE